MYSIQKFHQCTSTQCTHASCTSVQKTIGIPSSTQNTACCPKATSKNTFIHQNSYVVWSQQCP